MKIEEYPNATRCKKWLPVHVIIVLGSTNSMVAPLTTLRYRYQVPFIEECSIWEAVTTPPYNPYKNPTTAVLIAAIGGIFGISGIGHMYVGKIMKGIIILIAGFILAAVGALTVAMYIGIPLLIGYLALWIWQIFDARKLANQFNEYYQTNQRPPW